VDRITVKEVFLGPNLPTLSQAQLISVSPHGEIVCDCDVQYSGGLKLVIEVIVSVNISTFSFEKTFPVSIAITLLSLSGKIRFYCGGPPADKYWLGFHKEPDMTLNIDTEIANSYTFKNLSNITNILVELIKMKLIKIMMLPNMDDYPIPPCATKVY